MDGLHVAELLQRNPLAYRSRTVKAFTQLPRLALSAQFLLQLASGEVDAHRHGVVIARGETLGDGLAKARDAHNKLSLIVDASEVIGYEEGLVVLQQRRVGFCKDDGLLWFI